MIYLVTANTTYCYDLSRYSQYYIAILYLVTANTTLLCSILLQPILHYYDLFCYSQYYNAMIYLVQLILNYTDNILLDTTLVMNYEYKADRIITHEQGDRPPLLENPTDAHTRSG